MIDFSLYWTEFLTIAMAMFIGLMSPGPDFALVLKQSVSYGKKASIYTSLGIGLGISVHVVYTVLGVGLIISKSIFLFNAIKILGAAYLIYLGIKSFNSKGFKLKKDQSETIEYISNKKSFTMGFLCNALNPKPTLFFLSIFTVIVDVNTPIYVQTFYGLVCILETIIWFVFLSLILSHSKVRRFFNSFGKWFDRTFGVILIAIGIKLALLG